MTLLHLNCGRCGAPLRCAIDDVRDASTVECDTCMGNVFPRTRIVYPLVPMRLAERAEASFPAARRKRRSPDRLSGTGWGRRPFRKMGQ